MSVRRADQCRHRLWRVQDRSCKTALILYRETDDLRFLNRAVGRLLGGSDDKIAHRPALQLRRAFDHGERFRRDPRFQSS